MRLGRFHPTYLSSRQEEIIRIAVYDELRTIEVKQSIARLARSEVKNYLAALAEGASAGSRPTRPSATWPR